MAERNTFVKDGIEIPLPVAASTKIEAGNMVAINASGYAIEATTTEGLKVAGIAQETVDNLSGSNGDKTVLVKRKKAFKLGNSGTDPVTQDLLFSDAAVEDSTTVMAPGTAGTDVTAGPVLAIDSDGVWIEI